MRDKPRMDQSDCRRMILGLDHFATLLYAQRHERKRNEDQLCRSAKADWDDQCCRVFSTGISQCAAMDDRILDCMPYRFGQIEAPSMGSAGDLPRYLNCETSPPDTCDVDIWCCPGRCSRDSI